VWHSYGSTSITLVGSIGGTDCHRAPGACISATSLTNPTNILASASLTFECGPRDQALGTRKNLWWKL
jgi:hypothetical protein